MRCFLALDINKKDIEKVYLEVKNKIKDKVKANWVPVNNLHITYLFFGEIKYEKIQEVINEIEKINVKLDVKSLIINKIGSFNNRVLFFEVNNQEVITNRNKIVKQLINKRIIPKEKSEFHAHITIARVKNGLTKEVINEINNIPVTKIEIKELCMYQSSFTYTGVKYDKIKCWRI